MHFISAPVFQTVAAFPPLSFYIFHFHCGKKQKTNLRTLDGTIFIKNIPTSSTVCAQSGRDVNAFMLHIDERNTAAQLMWQISGYTSVFSMHGRHSDDHQ